MRRRKFNDNRRVGENPEGSSSNRRTRNGSNMDGNDKKHKRAEHYSKENTNKSNNCREKQSFSRHKNDASGSRSHDGRREIIMGFKMTQELIKNDDIEDVIFRLSNKEKSFKTLLDEYKMQPDLIVLIVKLITKISESAFTAGKTHLLNVVLSSNFLEILIKFISTIAIQDNNEKMRNKHFWKDTDDFFLSVISMLKIFNNLLPSNSCEINHKVLKTLKFNLLNIEEAHKIHISDDIKNQVEQLLDVVAKTMEEIEVKKKIKQHVKAAVTDDLLQPPDDFRFINVFPNAAEITNRQKVFLRSNVITGPYQNVEHYLDIQFRLYREDFVIPLRHDICNYICDNRCKLENMKIYKAVKFIIKQMRGDSNVYIVQFDFSKTKKSFQYENSKRFMYGALLCFTPDCFKTLFFGTVAGRDLKFLEKGQIEVKIVTRKFDLPADLFQLEYIMVESTVFFEPYFQILNCLKQLSSDNFPMERYIINVEPSSRPPKYLLDNTLPFTVDRHTFSPLHWNRHFPDLNQAQNDAFKAAITNEFVLIQGPPGTGKTYLGLKIAKTLLNNAHIWYKNTPMVIICYTNHALDQFLEGLLDTTEKLIRVGRQSKNETLETFNIHNFRRNRRKPEIILNLRAEERKLFSILEKINNCLIIIESYSCVLNFELFEEIYGHYYNSWFAKASKENILDWLLQYQDNYKMNSKNNVSEQLTEASANDDAPLLIELEENEDENEELSQAKNERYRLDHTEPDEMTLISINSLLQMINKLQMDIKIANSNDYLSEYDKELEEYQLNFCLFNTTNCLEELAFRMQERKQLGDQKNPPTYVNLQNPHFMSMDQRWQLYFYWLYLLKNHYHRKRELLGTKYKEIYDELKEYETMEDAQIMKEAKVIGMTTTCAARLQSSLQVLKSPIVIVEEAAEILESHVVTSLTPYCEHLILIGDHQQLKPSTATYQIENTYRLDVSLFERMIMNGMKCHTLDVQHRMRPEIANLVRTNIYKTINDHPSVLNREPVRGLDCNLFFIDHTEPEVICENGSKKNVHEAQFLVQLASYLVLNGYRPDQIILLAAYLGQMYEMQRERRHYKSTLENVRIAVLDNYQGEECDIVLLSLVRNNAENIIGFLNRENRVCVALSRARNGFYIMGNMKLLCAKSKIWTKIEKTLIDQKAIGQQLILRCQVHNKITPVSKHKDFFSLSEGGCDLLCGKDLNCGHTCKRLCHSLDREHVKYKCLEKCNKPLCENEQHLCKKMCFDICGPCTYLVKRSLRCGHDGNIACHLDPDKYDCPVDVEVTLNCGHKVMKPCFVKVENFLCPVNCDTRVEPCGHSCLKKCHFNSDPDHLKYICKKMCGRRRKGCTDSEHGPCNKLCYEDCVECAVPVLKKRTACDHMYRIACSANPDDIDCEKPCKKMLPCNHVCPMKCNQPCGNCQEKVEKIVPECNHKILMKCCELPTRNNCKENCTRLLKCGHKCNKKCKEPCNEECREMVDININSPCGHTIKKIYCFVSSKSGNIDKLLMRHCSEKCGAQLQCGHRCSGTCGSCFQGRFHVRCQEKCGVILVCNHECGIPCREACRPCDKPCEYRCKHSKCKKTCGNPCTQCKEDCPRRCAHQKCRRKCGQFCDIPPCTEPCAKKIKCGHPCVGFCGDPCPQLCRICDEEQLTETFFGTETEEDARFVLLEDCGHILESEGMEYWLKQGDSGYEDKVIKPIECPKCKTTIRKSSRYSNYVKENMRDLFKVKSSFYGTDEEISRLSIKLKTELQMNHTKFANIIDVTVPVLRSFFTEANNRLAPILKIQNIKNKTSDTRRNTINKMNLNDIRIKMDLINLMLDSVSKFNEGTNQQSSIDQMDFIGNLVVGNGIDSVSKQEITDIKLEINRLNRLVQLESIPNFSSVLNKKEEVKNLILKKCSYDENLDKLVKENLEKLKKSTSSPINLTDVEKKNIVQALGLTPGHWFKCPNGHPYIITECGGAMQTSRCNECQAPIGGSNHTLLASNAVASEMDGARHAAWSDGANMANYML